MLSDYYYLLKKKKVIIIILLKKKKWLLLLIPFKLKKGYLKLMYSLINKVINIG